MAPRNRILRNFWILGVVLVGTLHPAWALESALHQQVQRVGLSFLNRDWNVQLTEVLLPNGSSKGPWTYVRSQSENQWIWIQARRGPLDFEPNFRTLDRILEEILQSRGGMILLVPSPYDKQIREGEDLLSNPVMARFRILVPLIQNDGAGVLEIVRDSGRYRTQEIAILPNFTEALRFGILSEYKASHNLSSLWIKAPRSISLRTTIQNRSSIQFKGDFILPYTLLETEKGYSGLRERTILHMIRKWLRDHYSVWRELDSKNVQFSSPQEMLRLQELESAIDPVHEAPVDGVLIGEIVKLRMYQRMSSLFDKLYDLLEVRSKLEPKQSIWASLFERKRLPVLPTDYVRDLDLENLYIFSEQLKGRAAPRPHSMTIPSKKERDVIPSELLLWAYAEIQEDIENLWRRYENYFGVTAGIDAPMFQYSDPERRETARRTLFRDTLLRILRARIGKKKPLEQNALYRSAKDFEFDPLAPHQFSWNTAIAMMDLRILWIIQEVLDGVPNLKSALMEDAILDDPVVGATNPYALGDWGFQVTANVYDRAPFIPLRQRLLSVDKLRGREARMFLRR